MSDRPRIRLDVLLAVMAGGAVGAGLRALLLLPVAGGARADVVAVTLVENVVGSFMLGVVVAVLGDRRPRLRAFAGTGVLGGFTTYSTFAVQTAQSTTDATATAILLVLASLLLGLLAAFGGLAAGRRFTGARRGSDPPREAE
ncbi:CrcB family protein [Microbacterium sp. ET2]|uniref:fluoride efflux transporter FluC n=1 Tax=Microbacterium albipurpureum TaxID=3050384 RepID=UPI00259C8F18|nr:CrcB family protein [Microbacterium sp. ET2 (Ac-2212)]WJL97152.1 CrcB family protein [Microbacterium sp. ET2 (Ac-2212)]